MAPNDFPGLLVTEMGNSQLLKLMVVAFLLLEEAQSNSADLEIELSALNAYLSSYNVTTLQRS